MSRRRIALSVVSVIGLLLIAYCAAGSSAQWAPSLGRSVFGSGGTSISAETGITLSGTIGQPIIGSASSETTSLQAGFWHSDRSIADLTVYLPLLLRGY